MGKINTIIFDIGNVMVAFCWQKAISNMKLNKDIEDRLVSATIKSSVWDDFDIGILTEDEILEAFIKNDPEIEDVIRDFYFNHYTEIAEKYDYANEWVCSLKNHGYKVYFLSNFSERGFRELAPHLDFVSLGDGAVISYEEKLIKPDRRIYEILLDRYSIKPDEAVFIDDNENNIEAAKKLGIHGIVFKTRQQVLGELDELLKM